MFCRSYLLFISCSKTKNDGPVAVTGVWNFNFDSFSYIPGRQYAQNIQWNFKADGTLSKTGTLGGSLPDVPYKLLGNNKMVWTLVGYTGNPGTGTVTPVYTYDTVNIVDLTPGELLLSYKQSYLDAVNDTLAGLHFVDLKR